MISIQNEEKFNEDSYLDFIYFCSLAWEKIEENERDMIFTKDTFERIFEYIHTGRKLDPYFFNSEFKDIRKYCCKYGMFSREEIDMVKNLMENRRNMPKYVLSLDDIITKYQKMELETKLTYSTLLPYFVSKYANNDKRLIQILEFEDPYLLLSCFNLLMKFDMPTVFMNEGMNEKFCIENLVNTAPEKLSNTILNFIQKNEFDEMINLLQHQKSNEKYCSKAYTLPLYVKPNIHLTWEESIREVIEHTEFPLLFFSLLVDTYHTMPFTISDDYEEIDPYEATFSLLKLYLRKK